MGFIGARFQDTEATMTDDYKPYRHWTVEEKIEVSHRLLATLSDKRDGSQCSTTDPGPMPVDEMQLLCRIFRSDVEV